MCSKSDKSRSVAFMEENQNTPPKGQIEDETHYFTHRYFPDSLIVIFSTALVFTHNKAASAANVGTPQMGGEIEDSINSYTSLLSALYTQDEQELARHSSNEIALAKEKIDPLRESYTEYGMKIVDAAVSADVQAVQNIGETSIVDTILHTEITFLPSAVSGLKEPQKSSWDDSHTITLESAGTDMKRSGASDLSLQSDSVIPESSTSLNDLKGRCSDL